MRAVKIKIYGRVQGVGFRYSAQHAAQKLGLSVHAVNAPDGSVEIEAFGEEASLEKFIEWCHHGPTFAKIEKVKILLTEKEENELSNT